MLYIEFPDGTTKAIKPEEAFSEKITVEEVSGILQPAPQITIPLYWINIHWLRWPINYGRYR